MRKCSSSSPRDRHGVQQVMRVKGFAQGLDVFAVPSVEHVPEGASPELHINR